MLWKKNQRSSSSSSSSRRWNKCVLSSQITLLLLSVSILWPLAKNPTYAFVTTISPNANGISTGTFVSSSYHHDDNHDQHNNDHESRKDENMSASASSVSRSVSSSSSSSSIGDEHEQMLKMERRAFLIGASTTATAAAGLLSSLAFSSPANAINFGKFGKRTDILLLPAKKDAMADAIRKPFAAEFNSAEQCLLRLLPVKNLIFRKLESEIESVSVIRFAEEKGVEEQTWVELTQNLNNTIKYYDGQRVKLQPVFNADDGTELQIAKAERGEQLAESLRVELVNMLDAAKRKNQLFMEASQRKALLALANLGELLVFTFPYNVPTEGKFSYLPRLCGRARVTFTVKRKDTILGNVTLIADGFAAPITAGNFVDLCIRQFYNGLPVKSLRKRLGTVPTLTGEENIVKYDIENTIENVVGAQGLFADTLSKFGKATSSTNRNDETDTADDNTKETKNMDASSPPGTIQTTMSILGSYEEGFYDPLTAKPRRIPLEIVQFDRLSGTAKLSYAGKKSDLADDPSMPAEANTDPLLKPVLNFNIPGLVAMNHPDKNLNGGSSEFFSLQSKDRSIDKYRLLNGQYAPFGYIVEGSDLMESLRPNDVISSTHVSEWGALNLVKIRGTSFADVMSSNSNKEED